MHSHTVLKFILIDVAVDLVVLYAALRYLKAKGQLRIYLGRFGL